MQTIEEIQKELKIVDQKMDCVQREYKSLAGERSQLLTQLNQANELAQSRFYRGSVSGNYYIRLKDSTMVAITGLYIGETYTAYAPAAYIQVLSSEVKL